MLEAIYEIYFALRGNKLIHYERYYVVTYDMSEYCYKIWCVDGHGFVNLLGSYRSRGEFCFAWRILMNRGESHVID